MAKKIFLRILIILLVLIALAAIYTFLFPLGGKIKAFRAPVCEGYTGDFAANDALRGLEYTDLGGYARPETVLFRDGYLYASTHGQLIRMKEDGTGTELLFDSKNGETLGFDFDADGNILFCDVRFAGTSPGIYKLDMGSRQVTPVCTESEGKPLSCPDALAVAKNGILYFSEATEFSPVKYRDADYAFQYEAYYHSANGKVCAFDPATGESWVVARGFSGANGIALSFDEQYLYVNETMEYCVWRIPVGTRNGTKGNGAELFISNVPGCVDNLNRGQDGRYWVGLVSARNAAWDEMLGSTFLRRLLLRYSRPAEVSMPEKGTAAAFAFDDSGAVVAFLMAEESEYHHVTGVLETDTRLYLHANNLTGQLACLDK